MLLKNAPLKALCSRGAFHHYVFCNSVADSVLSAALLDVRAVAIYIALFAALLDARAVAIYIALITTLLDAGSAAISVAFSAERTTRATRWASAARAFFSHREEYHKPDHGAKNEKHRNRCNIIPQEFKKSHIALAPFFPSVRDAFKSSHPPILRDFIPRLGISKVFPRLCV